MAFIAVAVALLIMEGAFHMVVGIAGLLDGDVYVATTDYWIDVNSTARGWLHVIFGTVLIGAAMSLTAGRWWGRFVAFVAALLSAVASFAFIPYAPIWAIVMIAVDVAIIWAVAAHGRELSAD